MTPEEAYDKGWDDAIRAAMEWYKTKQAVPLHKYLQQEVEKAKNDYRRVI